MSRAASLQYLWGMINVLQIIVHMPLINLAFPLAGLNLYSFIVSFSQFNILPTEWLNQNFVDYDEPSTQLEIIAFNNLGYQSKVAI